MAIPADDPRLAPVLVEREDVQVQALDRDEDGRLVFSESLTAFVPLRPFKQQYDSDAAENVLDTGISSLTTPAETDEQDTQTTTIT